MRRLIRSTLLAGCCLLGPVLTSHAGTATLTYEDLHTEIRVRLDGPAGALRHYRLGDTALAVETGPDALRGVTSSSGWRTPHLDKVRFLGPDLLGGGAGRLILSVPSGVELASVSVEGRQLVIRLEDVQERARREAVRRKQVAQTESAAQDLREQLQREREARLDSIRQEWDRDTERQLQEEEEELRRDRKERLEALRREEQERLRRESAEIRSGTDAELERLRSEGLRAMQQQLDATLQSAQEDLARRMEKTLEEERRRHELEQARALSELKEEEARILQEDMQELRRQLEGERRESLEEERRQWAAELSSSRKELRETVEEQVREEERDRIREMRADLLEDLEKDREQELRRFREMEAERTRRALEEAQAEAERRRKEALRRFWEEADKDLERQLDEARRQSQIRLQESLRAVAAKAPDPVQEIPLRGSMDVLEGPTSVPAAAGEDPYAVPTPAEVLRARKARLTEKRRQEEAAWQMRRRWTESGEETRKEIAAYLGNASAPETDSRASAAPRPEERSKKLSDLMDVKGERQRRYRSRLQELASLYTEPVVTRRPPEPEADQAREEPVTADRDEPDAIQARRRPEPLHRPEPPVRRLEEEEEAPVIAGSSSMVSEPTQAESQAEQTAENPAPRRRASQKAELPPPRISRSDMAQASEPSPPSEPRQVEETESRDESDREAEELLGEPQGRLEAQLRRQEKAIVKAERARMKKEQARIARLRDQEVEPPGQAVPKATESGEGTPPDQILREKIRIETLEKRRRQEQEKTIALRPAEGRRVVADTILRSGPAFLYPRVGRLASGDRVEVDAVMEDWVRVRDEGWVYSVYLQPAP